MDERTTPYACHVFVCVNDRHGARKSCADGGGNVRLKDALKEEFARRGLAGRVRVSHCGCMGLCQHGPNVLLHPAGIWLPAVSPDDLAAIADRVESLVGGAGPAGTAPGEGGR
jgi:(2Fe-2S) ferredoxin